MQLGIDDPEQWLEQQPDRVVAYWEAFDQRRPIGCDWEKYAAFMSMLEVLIAAISNPNLEKQDRIKPRSQDEFLPAGLRQMKRKQAKVSLHKQLQILAKAYGGRYGDDNQ